VPTLLEILRSPVPPTATPVTAPSAAIPVSTDDPDFDVSISTKKYAVVEEPKRCEFGQVPLSAIFEELGRTEAFEVGPKGGENLTPALFRPCPAVCWNHGKADAVDCGGGKKHKLNKNVLAMSMLGVEFDYQPEKKLEGILQELTRRGITHVWWNTRSHDPAAGDNRFRILIPFAKPLPILSASKWSKDYWPVLCKHLGLEGSDKACRDPRRIYYTPCKPTPESPHQAGFHKGGLFDWFDVLGAVPETSVVRAEPVVIKRAPEDLNRPVDPIGYKEKLKRFENGEHAPRLKKVLAGQAPTPPHDRRKPGEPSRYEAWRGVTTLMAFAADDRDASEALLSVAKPAWRQEVIESQDDPTDVPTEWEKIVFLFESARDFVANIRASEAAYEADIQKLAARVRENWIKRR